MFAGLRKPMEMIVIVVTLLAYGCPVQAIVHAFELDERTVASWRDRDGKHCERLHHVRVEQGQLDLVHVQADEIRVKGRKMIAWMGLSLMVSTRLWLGGVVSLRRDTSLADRMLRQVRACSQAACALLVCTDGWAAYPGSIKRAFREKGKKTAGRGRVKSIVSRWPETLMERGACGSLVFFTIYINLTLRIFDFYHLVCYTVTTRNKNHTLLSPQDQLRYFPASVVACKATEHPLCRFDEEQEMQQR